MRLFLILYSFVTIINAKPQGYNYSAGESVEGGHGVLDSHGSSFSGSLSGFGSSHVLGGPANSNNNGPSFGSFHTGKSVGEYGHGSSFGAVDFGSGVGGSFGTSFGNTGKGISTDFGSSSGGFNAGASHNQDGGGFESPIVHKQFITITAPEDRETLEKTKHFLIGRPQKNYRVVFIKAPSSSAANVKLSAEYAPQEEKTVIYVLSKQDSTLEVSDIATPAPTVPSKPEVVFIKYKTEEEAHHAQQQIQAEYDKIEGTSEHTDGGVGQQQSVVGILDGGGDGSSGHVDNANGGGNGGITGGNNFGSSSMTNIFGSGVVGSSGLNTAKSSIYLPPSKIVSS